MKMKNLIAFAMLALGAVALPFAGRAEVSGGDIYSVDLVERGGSVIPTVDHPLTIGQEVVVRVRLLNRGYDASDTTKPWYFAPTTSLTLDPNDGAFAPQLGLMFGGQPVYADFDGDEQVYVGTPKVNKFTDLFFRYRVKSGDLALPARFMSTKGVAIDNDSDAHDYALHFCNYLGGYWRITNASGDDCTGTGKFHFGDVEPVPHPDPTWEAGEPHRFITGTGLGVYAKTIDFDTSYYKDPSMPGVDDGVWRQLYMGLTTALPSLPTIKVDGLADQSSTMYVWVENDDPEDPVAQVLASDNPEKVYDTKGPDPTKYRWVLKVPVAKGSASSSFRLQGVREGKVKVRMSSSRELSYNESGDLIEDWVERWVSVVPPPDPYVMVEMQNPAGDPLAKSEVQLTADYENYVAMMRFTLLQEPSADLTVTLVPDLADGDIFGDGLLGLSLTTDDSPWLNEDLTFTVKKGDPLTKTIYVYAKGTTSKLSTKGVTFTINTAGAPEYDGESGKHSCKLLVKYMTPVLVKPTASDAITDAMAGKNYSLDITISDARKHMVDAAAGDAAYTVYWKVEAPGTEGEWDSDDAVALNDADTGEATISVPFDVEGECNLLLYVLSPSGKKSPITTVPVTVAAPKRATATLDRVTGVYAEGESAYVNIHLTQKYKSELYAFFVPQDDDTKEKFATDISSETAGAIGCYIGPGETDTKVPVEIAVNDGRATGRFQVFMCTTKNYSKTKSGGYIGDIFTISATNVVPRITKVEVSGSRVLDGEALKDPIVMDVAKKFQVFVDEPSQVDKKADGANVFRTQWKFGSDDWIDMDGNPDTETLNHTFTAPGTYQVEVRCQDKDMRTFGQWSESLTFTLTVLDTPQIVITPIQETKQYYEDQTGIDYGFKVSLTAAPKFADSTKRLKVEIVKELLGNPADYSLDDLVLSKDYVEFASGKVDGQSFYLKQLDGTVESAASGFRLVLRAVDAMTGLPLKDDDGKSWEAAETELYILNRDPTIRLPNEQLTKDDVPVPTPTAVGKDNTLTWALTDVIADTNRMSVTFSTSEGAETTYTQGVNIDNAMKGTHTWAFASAGDKSITMTVTDKDGGTATRTWYYTIEASKSMTIVPHLPAGGYGTANSKRYRTAAGLGEGRVWARNLTTLDSFKSQYNCGVSGTWDVYGYGYKVGDVDDGVNLHDVDGALGYYTNRDTPIDENGDPLPETGGTAYAYNAKSDRHGELVDSFLYTWLQISYNGDGGSGASSGHTSLTDEILGKAFSPEYTGVRDTGVTVVLPGKSDNEKDTYTETILEAIFSREYLATDNMGDINQDGIPDIYVDKYGLGVMDTGAATVATQTQIKGDDLKPITAENHGNDDEDFLPLTGVSALSKLIPGLPEGWSVGTPFSAKLEIRGYGEGLNDAPLKPWISISGVKPERRYTDPRVDPRSTLDGLDPNGSGEPVEYYAWLEWALSQGITDPTNEVNKGSWELWSPECPSDPTLKDTDDDGFLDGYEYFFWYRAHVGYMDGGVHTHMTGRRYEPRNPGEGTVITSAEIERLMNPGESSGGDLAMAKLRDTDNDGLPDMLEFEIGTNPFDFDTDGDGLPDGFELMLGGTDPLLFETTPGTPDSLRNFDGDAMAFTSPAGEEDVTPTPWVIDALYTFALPDEDGDTDGVQWYVSKEAPNVVILDQPTGLVFTVGEKRYFTTATHDCGKLVTSEGMLCRDLEPDEAWCAEPASDYTNSIPALAALVEANSNLLVRLMPIRLVAGLKADISDAGEVSVTNGQAVLLGLEKEVKCNSAWVYGHDISHLLPNGKETDGGQYGMLTIGRAKAAPKDVPLAALPTEDPSVCYLHYLVYQEFQYDPRTAWNPTGAGRVGDGNAVRTRPYSLYDEFMLMSFFLNNGTLTKENVTPSQARPWETIWSLYTTNGQGPNEPNWEEGENFKGRTAESNSGGNGADTDRDGVPDGWELYVMTGPSEGGYIFAGPYDPMSPLVADASDADDDKDDLSELEEYSGTDSSGYYSKPAEGSDQPYSTTIVQQDTSWLNKFGPTDPWNADTDGDGLMDNEIKDAKDRFPNGHADFIYGSPIDDGLASIPGGGLNPLAVDTDMDGLPDMWEAQFAGEHPYDGPYAVYQQLEEEGPRGNVLQGLCDGMDGTVPDASSTPYVETSPGTNSFEVEIVYLITGNYEIPLVVDRDYDHDGLENWQEYMAGTMRCWRYDDPTAGIDNDWYGYIPHDWYFDMMGNWAPNYRALSEMAGVTIQDDDTLLYHTLVNESSPIFNPHFVTDQCTGQEYFSRVKNVWDPAYGLYYIFHNRREEMFYMSAWNYEPMEYISCSPLESDTDGDGMDDYYELFHGMNPLLGLPGGTIQMSGVPRDIVSEAYGGVAGNAIVNCWCPFGLPEYNFFNYPWINGLVDADPDGDDIRNQDEAIVPLVAPSSVWYHTDPTPLWMTDASFDKSLTRMFFRMPTRFDIVVPALGGRTYFEHGGKQYPLWDFGDFYIDPMLGPAFGPFSPDFWGLAAGGCMNWMYSFEENEGFDTDHDGISDYEEMQGRFRSRTDPQDADSPRRRQAMYFPGKDAALQSLPYAKELYPRGGMFYEDDLSFLQYTVECWVRPESLNDGTVIERAILTGDSHRGDEQFIRCNFRIAVKDGKWYTMFEPNGTLANAQVEVLGVHDVKVGEWTYVAATYDAQNLTLYVNGAWDGQTPSSLKPTYGANAIVLNPALKGTLIEEGEGEGEGGGEGEGEGGDAGAEVILNQPNTYWFDMEYELHAILVGASFLTDFEGARNAKHLNLLNGVGWGNYRNFFKGYVDEIRIWDGAQTSDVIAENYRLRKRFTREDALDNRNRFYSQWNLGRRRYAKDNNGQDVSVIPELRYHWAFDSLNAAENPAAVAPAPHGFLTGAKAPLSAPDGYEIPWWSTIVDGYGSVYAGLRNWVTWIPNTVTHLPRFDGSTLDSAFWSEDFQGDTKGYYNFARTAEPVSLWTQLRYNGLMSPVDFQSTARRFRLTHTTGTNVTSSLPTQFEFTGRHLNMSGDDLLPLGGAFVRYVDKMWDDMGAASTHENSGSDVDNDGLPDWWQEYADQNYREGLSPFETITWDTVITYEIAGQKMKITAGEAYQRDLAKGVYQDEYGVVHPTFDERAAGSDKTQFEQTAKTDKVIPDWWKSLMKIDDEEPFADTDNDGLNNYVEYIASELMPFKLILNPRLPMSDAITLDYFRRPFDGASKLYVGEMLTDHDQMEDHWERSLGNEAIASASLWDALKDGEEDGWNNFAENRYNGYMAPNLAQLVSHAVGTEERFDMPIPTIRLKVRYNGNRPLVSAPENEGNGEGQTAAAVAPALVIRASSADPQTGDAVITPDATWTFTPGVTVADEVYLGGWEDRIVRGTMAPGNVDIASVNLFFAQIPQSDIYSWTDETGTHISGTYAQFKEALAKDPTIIQNVDDFEWSEFLPVVNEYVHTGKKPVTVTRDATLQTGYIAVYGERVGTINLTTGDFEFDLGALLTLSGVEGVFKNEPSETWGFKEGIFKLTYSATVPSAQLKSVDISLARPKSGFVRSGKNAIEAFYDIDADGHYTPGEPFGVIKDVDIGWAGCDAEIELTDMSAITPRVLLWGEDGEEGGTTSGTRAGTTSGTSGKEEEQAGGRAVAEESDRGVLVGTATFEAGDDARFEVATAPAPKSRVRVVRYKVDKFPVYKVGVDAGVVLEKDFEQESRDFLHEGDFLAGGDLDIDWKNLYTDVVDWSGVQGAACEVTNVTYLIVYNWDAASYRTDDDTNSQVKANATLVTRRFEKTRSVPTTCPERSVYNLARPTFSWKIVGEDKWASWFGTTYTAFKVRVKDLDDNLVYDSGIRRLPAKDSQGVYTWTAPLYVGEAVPGTGVVFQNLKKYTWEVAVYNAKFKTDTLMAMERTGNPFSKPETFRMNVTTIDASSEKLAVRVCYAGPATNLLDRIRVQAYVSPDFTGDPAAETTLRYVDMADTLSPVGADANVEVFGLPAGSYFIRAYIDTNNNGVHDDWESWGYLNERDQAGKKGIFNPVKIDTALEVSLQGVRKVFIEDCDTDGDWFPDVWEAEQNGNVFDRTKIAPVSGDAELIGANAQLANTLSMSQFPMLEALFSRNGLALLSGVPPTKVRVIENSDGTLGIQVENKVETVKVTSMDFDANGNIEIKVAAATAPIGMDAAMVKLFNAKLVTQKTVTCTVYRRASLAANDGWTKAGSQVITIGNDEATPITVSGGKSGQGFYKVVIEE